jgi:hypothetical protein
MLGMAVVAHAADSLDTANGANAANAAQRARQRALEAPPVRSYPAPPDRVQRWIDRMDGARIRAHGWDIWQAVTSPSGEPSVPVWETWYSGHEIFEIGPSARHQRAGIHDIEVSRQVHQAAGFGRVPRTPAEQPLGFNRYSPAVANFIWDRKLNDSATLDSINAAFDRNNTPVIARQLQTSAGPVDAKSFVIKPVFQFIDGQAPTAVPVWTGISPAASTNLDNPSAMTWRRCVVVDPTGQAKPGSTLSLPCNAEPAQPWPVVALSDFFWFRLTPAEADAYSAYAKASGDEVGQGNKTDPASVGAMVKAGNIALLMAMHVTGKEISNWTWQTFWWAVDPGNPISGFDRPKTIGKPWSHYNMGTAYYMVSPPDRPDGDPFISFNPYLETNLVGQVAGPGGTQIAWTGVHSNCMSCHRMAAWKAAAKPQPGAYGDSPAYQPDGLIDPADAALFGGYTKLDFLWSLTRAQPQPPVAVKKTP